MQKTLTALHNEIRHLANPASLDCLPVSEAVEDHAPMARERRGQDGRDRRRTCATSRPSSF